MNSPALNKFLLTTGMTLKRHSPEILTGIGVGGMVTAIIMAVKATPKALSLLEEEKQKQDKEELTKTEVVKAAWKCYVPTAITVVFSASCLIGANAISLRRNAAIATAYSLSETALQEYRDKVEEKLGDKKEKEIRESLAKDKLDKNPVSKCHIFATGTGNVLCFDGASGRYFYSDYETIRKCINTLNNKVMNEMYVSLNEFYDLIGLAHIRLGENTGWNAEYGIIDPDNSISTQLAENDEPCLVLDFEIGPRHDFENLL